jgi:hypothetical protein
MHFKRAVVLKVFARLDQNSFLKEILIEMDLVMAKVKPSKSMMQL